MRKKTSIVNLLSLCLTLFDGAAAGASAGGSATVAGGESGTAAQAETKAARPNSRGGNKGESPVVVYGKQTGDKSGSDAGSGQKTTTKDTTDSAVTSDAAEAKKAAFEDLINGEYKDQFTSRTQQIINQRFKETKWLQAQVEQNAPILDALRQRYKLAGDATPDQVMKALEDDDAYWESAAEDAGMTVQQYKYVQKLARENEKLRLKDQRAESQQKANETYNQWLQQSEAMKADYPSFDLRTECQANEKFVGLLRNGVDVKTAYEVTHIDDVKKNVAQTTARKVETNVVSNIRAKGARPTENGVMPSPGIIVKDDVHKLTARDRAEIVRRARLGETIRF